MSFNHRKKYMLQAHISHPNLQKMFQSEITLEDLIFSCPYYLVFSFKVILRSTFLPFSSAFKRVNVRTDLRICFSWDTNFWESNQILTWKNMLWLCHNLSKSSFPFSPFLIFSSGPTTCLYFKTHIKFVPRVQCMYIAAIFYKQ